MFFLKTPQQQHSRASGTILGLFEPDPTETLGDDIMVVTFRNCIFEDIQHTVGRGGLEFEGIMKWFSPYYHIILEGCIFRHNYFPGTYRSPRGWAVSMRGGTLEMRNNCFYNNTFLGWGFVEAFDGTQVTQSGNFAELPRTIAGIEDENTAQLEDGFVAQVVSSSASVPQIDAVVTCNLIATSDLDEPDLVSDVECLDATEEMCPVDSYRTPPEFWTNNTLSNNETNAASAAAQVGVAPSLWFLSSLLTTTVLVGSLFA